MRGAVALLVLVVMAALVAGTNGDLLVQAWHRTTSLPVSSLLVLTGCAVLVVTARAAVLAVATPGLHLHRAALADQAAVGVSNGMVVAGSAVGAAAKATMLRSWGVGPAAVGASLVLTGVAPAFVTWVLAVVVHGPAVATGSASVTESAATVTGLVVVVASAGFWAFALTHPRPAATAAGLAGRAQRRLRRLTPRRWARAHHALDRHDAGGLTTEVHLELRRTVARRGLVLLMVCIATPLAHVLTLWCALAMVDVAGVTPVEVLSTVVLARVLLSVAPVPGGIGVAEVGLVTLLVAAGADRPGAVGAVVLFRAVTWLAPIALGGAGWWWWQRSQDDEDDPGLLDGDALDQDPRDRDLPELEWQPV